MLRKPRTIGFWRGRLPHWEVEDDRYFVTIHLAGAIPASGEERIRLLSEELYSKSTAKADAYIFNNPRKAGLVKHSEDWKYGGAFVKVLSAGKDFATCRDLGATRLIKRGANFRALQARFAVIAGRNSFSACLYVRLRTERETQKRRRS